MKLNPDTDLLQKEKPTNKWLFKDDKNKDIIRSISKDVEIPLSEENELVMKKLIDFVRWSQDKELNLKNSNDYLRPAVGLAAPQIGVNLNMFFVRFEYRNDEPEEFAMINPKIISYSKQLAALDGGEGCLSVDGDKEGYVPRHYKIVIKAYDYFKKNEVELTLRGYEAIVFQHEIEHNFGKLYYDRINSDDPNNKEEEWIII